MKIENTGLSVYKSVLEMQKQMVDMLIQENLQSNNVQKNSQTDNQKPQNAIDGNKVSIYA